MSKFVSFFQDENGASAAEYALILAIVGAGIAISAIFLRDVIGNAISDAGQCIESPSTAC